MSRFVLLLSVPLTACAAGAPQPRPEDFPLHGRSDLHGLPDRPGAGTDRGDGPDHEPDHGHLRFAAVNLFGVAANGRGRGAATPTRSTDRSGGPGPFSLALKPTGEEVCDLVEVGNYSAGRDLSARARPRDTQRSQRPGHQSLSPAPRLELDAQARQHDVAPQSTPSAKIRLVAAARGDRHDELEARHDVELLAATAERAGPRLEGAAGPGRDRRLTENRQCRAASARPRRHARGRRDASIQEAGTTCRPSHRPRVITSWPMRARSRGASRGFPMTPTAAPPSAPSRVVAMPSGANKVAFA